MGGGITSSSGQMDRIECLHEKVKGMYITLYATA